MGEDGKPYIVEEEAEIIRKVFGLFLDGLSTQRIADIMQEDGAARRNGSTVWNRANVDKILKNEKYVGDAILQKTYTIDCITHKRVKNNGEKNKYIMQDVHPAIIDRDTWNRTKQELARRNAIRKRSDKARTEQGHYASKYALSDILICGECGTPYRRVTWTSHGNKLIVWRCISRLDYGNKYCKDSPSINEEKLQTAIVGALNAVYAQNAKMLDQMESNIRTVINDDDITSGEIEKMERRLAEIDNTRNDLVELIMNGSMAEDSLDKKFQDLNDEEAFLKQQIEDRKSRSKLSDEKKFALMAASEELRKVDCQLTEYDDVMVRKVIECIRVLSKTRVQIIFKGGYEMEVEV